MEIIIHQVICGQVAEGGFGCLNATLTDESLANSIAFKSDLQDPDGGVEWEPVVRGFLLNENFLLIKTFADKGPDARPGRNFSHVLVIEKVHLQYLTNIEVLFGYFLTKVDKTYEPEIIRLSIKEKAVIDLDEKLQKRFNKVIHGIHKISTYTNTIIWVGQENYELVVAKLWQLLSIEQKLELNLGINFNIDAIKTNKLNFIAIPDVIENKFLRTEYCIISKTDNYELNEFSEQFLAGNDDALNKIKFFSETVQSRRLNIREIELVAKVIPVFENLDQTTDLKKLLTLSNIIAEYSPDSSKGREYKKKLVESITKTFDHTDASDLYLLKQFKVIAFQDSEKYFERAVGDWLINKTQDVEASKSSNVVALIKIAFEEVNKNWLSKYVIKAIKSFSEELNEQKAKIIYDWFSSYPEILKKIKLNDSDEIDDLLFDNLNEKFDKKQLALISDFAIEKKWYRLLAKTYKLRFSAKTAIKEFISTNDEPNNDKGIDVILSQLDNIDVLNEALDSKDTRIIAVAASLCHKDKNLLNKLDLTNLIWLEIWGGAIQAGNKLDDGILEIESKVFKIFDLLLDGVKIADVLLNKIADSQHSSILSYNKRTLLWPKFSANQRQKILLSTLSNLSTSLLLMSPKTELGDIKSEALKQDNFAYILKQADTPLVVFLFKNSNDLAENKLIEFLNLRAISLSSDDCIEIGHIISKNRFKNAFNLINDKLIKKNSNFNQTVTISANSFKKRRLAIDFLEVLGSSAPKINYNSDSKIKILFLSANPNSTDPIRVGAELRNIDDALQASKFRERFDLVAKTAVKFDTFSRAILENKPHIIHFSGHADKQGIALEMDDGQIHMVSNETLKHLLGLFKEVICVVLNACYTESQAKVISAHGIYVVGMNDKIEDDAAINFSVGFYQSIGAGEDPKFSYEYAMAQILAKNSKNSKVPVLWYDGKKIGSLKLLKTKK